MKIHKNLSPKRSNGAGRKLFKSITLFSGIVLALNMSTIGVFFVAEPTANACEPCQLSLTNTKTGSDTAVPGEEITYRLTLKNTGAVNCTGGGVRIKDDFDPNTTFVSADADYENLSEDYAQWNFGTVEPGGIKEINLIMAVSQDASCNSVLENKAKFGSDEYEKWGDYIWSDYVYASTAVICESAPICGDGEINQDLGEECDDGNTDDGDGCDANCQIETSGSQCGDGTINQSFEECDDGNNIDGDFCDANCAIEYSVVINEIMQNPDAVNDSKGEWFEVYNTTDSPIDLSGCIISDSGSDSHTIDSSLIVPAFEYAVLGRNENPGVNGGYAADYVYSGFTLGNGDDEVILICNGIQIDIVKYDGGPNFPDPTGKSMILNDPADDNNIGLNWCTSSSAYGDGDLGTPGYENDTCGEEPEYGYLQICKYVDDDGILEDGEERDPVGGWEFILDSGTVTTSYFTASTEEDGNGCTEVIQLETGDYDISEVLGDGWTAIDPATGSASVAIESNKEIIIVDFVNYYGSFCGDGITQNPNDYDKSEQCDDGADNGEICEAGDGGNCSYCSNECEIKEITVGGGYSGGGGYVLQNLYIFNIGIMAAIDGSDGVSVNITWATNKKATTRVIYDTESHSEISGDPAPNYGYAYSTIEADTPANTNGVTGHSVIITGLTPNTQYFFRPISSASPEKYGTEISFTTTATAETENDAETVVLGEEGAPALTIDKTVKFTGGVDFANPGDEIEYNIKISNIGNLSAFNVVLKDVLPDGFTFSDGGGAEKTWDIGDMIPGANKVVSYKALIGDNVAAGVYSNSAEVSAPNYYSIKASADVEVREMEVLGAELAETGFSFKEFAILAAAALSLLALASVIRRRRAFNG